MATNIFRAVMFVILIILSYYAYKDDRPDIAIVFMICTSGYLITVVLERIFSKVKG